MFGGGHFIISIITQLLLMTDCFV